MNHKLFNCIILLCGVIFASGCQTTTSNSTLGAKNPEKAVQLRTQLAAEYIRQGQLDQAKIELDNALKVDSRSVDANAMMGVLLQQEGSPANIKLADGYFRRALSLEGDNAQVRNNYGTYLFQLQRFSEAAQQFKIAGETLGYQLRYRSLENLGQTYLRLEDPLNAELAFRQALQVNRNAMVAKLELAELLYQQQRFTLAGQMYEDYARSLDTVGNAQALWIGLRIARARGDNLGMQALVNQLRARYPNSVEYKRYLQLKDSSEAIWK
jgi:type IV pilus assembly protein PilF